MASSPNGADESVFDQFLTDRGHAVDPVGWERDRNKLQCPECGGLHDTGATRCTVCGWKPVR